MAGATPGAGRTGVKRSLPICRLLKQGRRLGSLRLLHGFGLGVLNGLLRGLRFLLGGELLLDLEGDGVGVHLIDSGGIMKSRSTALSRSARRQVRVRCMWPLAPEADRA